ncbi:unnamed protein product [Sphagnum troendelagicum]|uniref:S-adenosyl-L-methionine-dependent methyltransferase n=1 Tax=Sphagnum troendelagicum TaxID=128251 RepID=A0ABP0UJ80_9BRYO
MHSVLLLPLAVVGAFAVKLPHGSAEEKKKRAVDAKGCHHQQVALSSESSSPQRTRVDPIGLFWERKRRRHHHLHVACCSFHSKCRNAFDAAATNREESRRGGTEPIVVAVTEEEEGERLVTEEDWEKPLQDSDTRILANFLTAYNIVHVVEVSRSADHLLAGARILLLDSPANVHSVWYQHKVLTNSYYDEFATLMPLLPDGPVGIYGLGAGATAHIIQHFWPAVTMHGWELDPDIITVARQFFNLAQLETQSGRKSGKLFVYIGDALASDATVEGGFAGLIVDLFAHGAVIPPLMLPETWEQLKSRLRPEGRIMVNCGGSWVEAGEGESKSIGQITMEGTIAAIVKVFSGQLSRIYLERNGRNTLVMTGPSPDMQAWSEALPRELRALISDWVAVP